MKSITLKRVVIITAILLIVATNAFTYGGHNGNHGNNHNEDGHNSGCYTDGDLNHEGTEHYSGNHSTHGNGHHS